MKLLLTIETDNIDELLNILNFNVATPEEKPDEPADDFDDLLPVVTPSREITLVDLQEVATAAITAKDSNKAAIRKILAEQGVKKITDLNNATYPTVYEAIKSL